ncbi:GFA family protein [Vibrio sp. WXL103]|uniref:GFA family protein n=1 Tax=unclassified Vibrio TaxID=2614977 RepID=UPI003EC6299B
MSYRSAKCSCGQLIVVTKAEPVRVSVCHCEECQRRTGSAFGVQARFDKADVEIKGDAKSYTRSGDSGGNVTQSFCMNCGSVVSLELDGLPNFITIPVGLFADQTFPRPKLSLYQGRKHDWLNIEHEVESENSSCE